MHARARKTHLGALCHGARIASPSASQRVTTATLDSMYSMRGGFGAETKDGGDGGKKNAEKGKDAMGSQMKMLA